MVYYKAIFGPGQKKSCSNQAYFILRRSHGTTKAGRNVTYTVQASGAAEDAEECRNAGN